MLEEDLAVEAQAFVAKERATASYCRRMGVYSEGRHERGGRVKSRWREDTRLG